MTRAPFLMAFIVLAAGISVLSPGAAAAEPPCEPWLGTCSYDESWGDPDCEDADWGGGETGAEVDTDRRLGWLEPAPRVQAAAEGGRECFRPENGDVERSEHLDASAQVGNDTWVALHHEESRSNHTASCTHSVSTSAGIGRHVGCPRGIGYLPDPGWGSVFQDL